jgi:phosphomannomutase
MNYKIRFGTDGWRAIIAQDFTCENVARVTEAVAIWLKSQTHKAPSVVIGHDCRFGGPLFLQTALNVFIAYGIKVHVADAIVSTPMVSLATLRLKADLGIVLTASHNPPSYNGFKIKGPYGGPLAPEQVQEIEAVIPNECSVLYTQPAKQNAEWHDLQSMYIHHLQASFDLEAIKSSGLKFAYDAMYGAGMGVMHELFPEIPRLHSTHNPGFDGQAPEPIHKNLTEFSKFIATEQTIACGLATDGDADRIGLYNAKGVFIDSHHIILLLIHYLVKYKGMRGKVVTAFSTTSRIKTICAHYGLDLEVVKIGFKYICAIMVNEDVLLGGEESGGIAIKGHIPERDGIWMGLTLWEFMAKSKKSLDELIQEVYAITGPFHFDRLDLHITEEQKVKVLKACEQSAYSAFGTYKVSHCDNLDGYKFFINTSTWIMIRASGTEPILRIYAEGQNVNEVNAMLEAAKQTVLQ